MWGLEEGKPSVGAATVTSAGVEGDQGCLAGGQGVTVISLDLQPARLNADMVSEG